VSAPPRGTRGQTRAAARALWLLLGVACAHVLPPPGGPEDKIPPKLIAVVPESLSILPDYKGDVEFQFDEVVSEGGQPNVGLGTGDLEKLIVLSPTEQVPKVNWKRSKITVKPREGWKPNRVYRVELLPGITDVSHNRSDSGLVITFTTGAPLPAAALTGRVVDWPNRKMGIGALVEAVLTPDSLVYRGLADSAGRFNLSPLPAGEYLVFSTVDANKNRRRDGREIFDSARVTIDSGSKVVPSLWMYPHDTVGPRIQNIAVADSLAATIELSQPLAPDQALDTSMVRIRKLPDSIPVIPITIMSQARYDTLKAQARAAADTSKMADTTNAKGAKPPPVFVPPPPRPGRRSTVDTTGTGALLAQRPALIEKLVVTVLEPWIPDTRYVFELTGLRNLSGVTADAIGVLPVPPRPKVTAKDSAAAADSAKAKSATDTTTSKAAADTTHQSKKPR